MKTIADLNSKWWYRLVKVIYIIIFVFITIGAIVNVSSSYSPTYNNDKSYLKCANGKELILSENGMFLVGDFMTEANKESAKSICFDGEREFKKEKIANGNFEFTRLVIISETENSGKYELVSSYTKRNWIATIGSCLLIILGGVVAFEGIRRLFYYVILGKINPKNN